MEKKRIIRIIPILLLLSFLTSTYVYGEPDWIDQKIQVAGYGVIDTTSFPKRAQAKLMARRAAALDADRNLLEEVLNLKLNSETTIRDVVSESDAIDIHTSGLIKPSYIVSADFGEDDICTVKKELNLYDVYLYLKEKNYYSEPAPEPVPEPEMPELETMPEIETLPSE